jgi:hypothetical protein
MGNTAPLWRLCAGGGLLPHELAFFCLGCGTFLATLWQTHTIRGVPSEVGMVTISYGCLLAVLRHRSDVVQKIRLLASYGFMVWFYFGVARVIPSLGVAARDDMLYAADRELFLETPAVYCQSITAPWLTDLLSACYLSFHVYLQWAVLHMLWRPLDAGIRLSVYLFTAYAVGFLGYLLVPALGPWQAFPELFTTPLTGGVVTQFNAWIVGQGSSVYDVFPSLHLLVTLVLLDHDWREVRWRFWIMILPTAGLVFATIYLRYHYAVDLLTGGGLFLILRWALAQWTTGPARALQSAEE